MIRVVVGSLLFVVTAGIAVAQSSPAQAPAAETAAATPAKQSFDQLQQQWVALHKQIGELFRKKPADVATADPQIKQLLQQADTMMGQLVQAGLAVFQADPKKYPDVNNMLIAIARFYVVGDQQGDGGDRYEKALPLIRALLNGGAGEATPPLWLWGGVSAFNVNEYDLAKKYFTAADLAGMLSNTPPGQGLNRAWQLAKGANESLYKTHLAWEAEQQIRAKEAKADDLPRVKLTTSRGEIVIELFENEAPEAVANFITLVKKGFYDGVVFHRVLPGFMAQGGDPTGTGSGGPGYNIRCECYQSNIRKHFRGSLSMAHAGRDTGGSQFFLTFVATSSLDGKHTVFGRVIKGMDAAATLKRRDPGGPGPKPTPDKIIKAEVLRDREHEYTFTKLPGR